MRTIGYFRVNKETEKAPSLAEQEEGFTRFCQERGYQPLMTFIDAGSTDKLGRTEYQHMLRYIQRDGEDAIVVVKSLSQLHPDVQELMYRLIELDTLGTKVLSIDEELASPLETVLQIWSAQRQCKKRGDAVKEAMKLKAVRGKGLGKPPYGYKLGADKRLEIVPEEAATVELIYQLYLQKNMGVRLIARYLNEQSITTRRGGLWSIVGIRDILRNRSYLGTSSRFGFRVPDSHKPIINNEAFTKVQERLTTKTKPRGRAPRSTFPLSGLAYCGYCGNRMIGVNRSQTWTTLKKGGRRKGEYRYYQCQSRTNQSVCQYHTRRADDLENIVLDTLRSLGDLEALAQLKRARDSTDKTSEQPRLERKLKALDRKFLEHLSKATEGAISSEDLRVASGDLLWERRLVQQRIALLEAEVKQEITPGQINEYTLEMLEELRERWDELTFPARKALLQHLIDRVVVYDDHVETTFKL
jgi:site-specific DNA recombinase